MKGLFFLIAFGVVPALAAQADDCRLPLIAEWLEAGSNIPKEKAFGFHGTSVEAVVHAARTGRFPIGLAEGVQASDDPYWYFYPNVTSSAWRRLVAEGAVSMKRGTLSSSRGENSKSEVAIAWGGAEDYALTIAQHHRFLSTLGLPITEPNNRWATSVLYPNGRPRKRGFSEADLARASRAAQRAKGVVLLIGDSAARALPVSNAAPGDDGVRFEVLGGLPVEHVLAIEPMDDDDWNLLEALGGG